MYFSDEITLLGETYTKDTINQLVPVTVERTVYGDITSVTGSENASAGQIGVKAEARAVVHIEDYSGERHLRYSGGPQLKSGTYTVYRTYVSGDCMELYLTEEVL